MSEEQDFITDLAQRKYFKAGEEKSSLFLKGFLEELDLYQHAKK